MTATPHLQIDPKLPVLAFNFEQLKSWATEIAERYADMVVTEDAITDVKRDMADINKVKKAVEDSRKEAVKRVSEPIRTFEAQIKEVCAIFDTAYNKLGETYRERLFAKAAQWKPEPRTRRSTRMAAKQGGIEKSLPRGDL